MTVAKVPPQYILVQVRRARSVYDVVHTVRVDELRAPLLYCTVCTLLHFTAILFSTTSSTTVLAQAVCQ